MGTVKPEDFTWLSSAEFATPQNGTFQVYAGYWWAINSNGEIAMYRRVHPQCNRNPDVVRQLMKNTPGAVGVSQLPVVFLPHRCEDYI